MRDRRRQLGCLRPPNVVLLVGLWGVLMKIAWSLLADSGLKTARMTCPRLMAGAQRSEGSNSVNSGAPSTRRRAMKRIGQSLMTAGAGALIGHQPAEALLEDLAKRGGCPRYDEVKSSSVSDFDVDRYMGIWYELAYHDWTQFKFCGCTRFNMTRIGNRVEDMFTAKCPHEDPGQTYAVNMSMTINPATPGRFNENAFYSDWPNMVLAVWRGPDGNYTRSIQMQCVQFEGRRAFVGINFLSRIAQPGAAVLNEMFATARELGIAPYGGNPSEMVVVKQQGCRYPITTDATIIRPLTPGGIAQAQEGVPYGVRVIMPRLGVRILDRSMTVPAAGGGFG